MEGSVAGGISASVQSNATVKSCSFSGTIRATVTTARAIGGIIADLESGTVDSCEVISGSTITASSRTNAGGIVGEMSGGYVTNCTVDATIIGATYIDTTRIGGIIGYMESSASQSNVSGNKWPAAYAQIGNDANSGSGGSDTIVPDTDTPTVPDAVDPTVAPEDAATTVDANGTMVAAAGQQIANGFTGVNGASVISSLLNSATAVEMATAAEVAGALGISEYEVGNATNGYKAIGWKFPDSAARPAVNTPIFVITRLGTTNHVGFGYVPHRRAGFENILAIKFDLFRDPSNTSNYMTVEAGENTVAATDSTGETSSSSEAIDETAEDTDSAEPIAAGARALNGMIFVTADGTAFAVKTDGTVPLQGQTVYGAAVPVVSNGGGSDSWENAYIINTVEDLKQMRDRVNAGTESGKYYKLAADLDLTAETDWEGIDLN
ncbi:MAG: hypothetical protein IJ576_00750, partial [Synergistaceae bacterium]|nr:hypothetical protein [Synergistaceae bacterium]